MHARECNRLTQDALFHFHVLCLLLSPVRLLLFSFKRRLDHSVSCFCFDSHLTCDTLPLFFSLPCANILSHSMRFSLCLVLRLSLPVFSLLLFVCLLISSVRLVFSCVEAAKTAQRKKIYLGASQGPCSYSLYVYIKQDCIIFTYVYVFIKP